MLRGDLNQSLVKQILLAIVGHDLETNPEVKRWSLLMGAPPFFASTEELQGLAADEHGWATGRHGCEIWIRAY